MKYTFTPEQDDCLQDYIDNIEDDEKRNAAQLWLEGVGNELTDSEINALAGILRNNADEIIKWLKGGIRPGHPH